jgi:hypothetical protein
MSSTRHGRRGNEEMTMTTEEREVETVHELGFIESCPTLYAKVESLGVPARVWDEVIGQMYKLKAWSDMPSGFGAIWMDWSLPQLRRYDYHRAEDVTDQEYVRGLLSQADAYFAENEMLHPNLADEGDGEEGIYDDLQYSE